MGYGVALLMVTGEFDLSIGSVFAISAAVTAIMIGELGYGPAFTIILVITAAIIYGISQALLVTKLGVPSLIITIGTLVLVRGAHLLLLGGTSASLLPNQKGVIMEALGGSIPLPFGWTLDYRIPGIHETTHSWGTVPIQVVWVFVFLIIFHYILFKTRFGYHIRAAGNNINSAETTGVDPEIIKISCFGICAGIAAFAGIAQLGRISSVSGGTGDGLALIVIAAVVLGGTKLSGGEGSMIGVFAGALVLALAQNILTIAGFGTGGYKSIITGIFIILAIALGAAIRGFSRDKLGQWYTGPARELATSPTEFFRERVVQKTADDIVAFHLVSIGVGALLLAVGFAFVNVIAPVLGLADVLVYSLLFAKGWILTVIMWYGAVMFFTLLAFGAVELTTRYFDRSGDYESTLSIVSYAMAPAACLALLALLVGFDIHIFGSLTVTILLVAIPVVAAILRLLYTGVSEMHSLPSHEAASTVVATIVVWSLAMTLMAVSIP
jgi:ribose/xylose/arabinose/galactoside ABC-type transport system permease subunit